MLTFNPLSQVKTKYLFFTGKGGVGKTSVACASAVKFADNGKKVLLISTDPASNLQDVFETELNSEGVKIAAVENLVVANLDPLEAAAKYKESVVGPYRDKLPAAVIANMEEQLSGSCTVEIAAFNEFSNFITDDKKAQDYDYIIFDTAPTGHTLRMLALPAAWSDFISSSTHGASCLGQLSGLEERKQIYAKAVATLADKEATTLILVSRLDAAPLKEAARAATELEEIGIKNQLLILNGVLETYDDQVSEKMFKKQKEAFKKLAANLKKLPTYQIPLRPYNITGIKQIRNFLTEVGYQPQLNSLDDCDLFSLSNVIDDIYQNNKKVIFTMGKGGVGKTTIAAAIALGLAKKGVKVHLTTTDPAAGLLNVISEQENMTMSHIDEAKVLEDYKKTVLAKAKAENMSAEDIDYIKEDLRSPCTQEIAVFRAFAQVVAKAKDQVVVIDTAPTGHTLLLLDATESYHKEVSRSMKDTPQAVKDLLPRLRNPLETEVVIVSLAETTPFYEAKRLEQDLKRAKINSKWWIINSSLYASKTSNKLLQAKASNEIAWIKKINHHASGHCALIKWVSSDVKGSELLEL